jgi:hypothetical protein
LNQEALKPIIDAITREVMRRLRHHLEGLPKIEEQNESKEKLLLVFTGGTGNFDNVLSQLKALSHRYHFLALFSPAAEKAFGKVRVRQDINFEEVIEQDLYTALTKTSVVVFPTLTQNTAAKAVMGIRDSPASEALACSLLLKKRVIAVQDSIPLRSMPPAYARMVGEILKRLEQLGVNMCGAEALREKISTTSEAFETKEAVATQGERGVLPTETMTSPKALILESKAPVTAEVIYKAAVAGHDRIILLPRTLVTPMAKDTAKDKNIILEWAVN